MKPRKWIIVACLLILALGTSLYLTKRNLEQNRNIERILIKHLSPIVGGTFDVEKVRIGFFSVYLYGIKVLIPLRSFALYVQDIKVGISFFKFITSHGDFTQSINKIIFINPVVDISFLEADTTTSYQKPSHRDIDFSVKGFPLKCLLVQNGTIHITDYDGERMTISEQLTGKLWGAEKDINFELKGKLAAKKRNLFISGVLSKEKDKQHVSVRLNKAGIKKPICWRNISVISGKLDGVCEFSFTDTTFPQNINAYGWITIENGIGKVDGIEKRVKDVNLKMNFSGSTISIDTLIARWNNIDLFSRGQTGFYYQQENRYFFRFSGIDPAKLVPELPELLKKNVSGKGWVEIDAIKREKAEKFIADLSAGGISIGENPVRPIAGKCSFSRENITIDTIYMKYSHLSAGLKGLVDFKKSSPAYSFSLDLSGDAGDFLSGIEGKIAIAGDIRGSGNDFNYKLICKGYEIAYSKVPLGNPHISISNKKGTVFLNTKEDKNTRFSISGKIDSIRLDKPIVDFDVFINKQAIFYFLKKIPDNYAQNIDSAGFSASIKGKLPSPDINGHLFCRGEKIKGTCNLYLQRENDTIPYRWHLYSDKVYLSDLLLPFSASGMLAHDTVIIDTFEALSGITGAGYLTTTEKHDVDLKLNCHNLSLVNLSRWFGKDDKILEKGYLNARGKVFGTLSKLNTRMQLHIRRCKLAGISSLETDAVMTSSGTELTILPFVVRKDKKMILSIDTLSNKEPISFSGSFTNVDIGNILKNLLPKDYTISGITSGEFAASESGFPIRADMYAKHIKLNGWKLDSVLARLSISKRGITVDELSAADSYRSNLNVKSYIPWSFLGNDIKEDDTLHASLKVQGDILASLGYNYKSPVGGTGPGDINIDFSVSSEQVFFHSANALINEGVLTVTPFVPDDVKDITLKLNVDNSSKLHLRFAGNVDKRPVEIFTSHKIPKGFEPLKLGQINCGILLVKTPKNGIPLYLSGFMERKKGNIAYVEFASRKPFNAFALSGPIDHLRITGTWIIRSAEFTFPFLEDEPPPEEDPFPYISWDMDVRPGNRKVVYFYNLGKKRRRFIRFTECYIDPSSSLVKIRGRDMDGTFRILGSLRSYKGYAFYGRNFDRNFEVGLDFAPQKNVGGHGYDNSPIIWGSAEAFSDTSRFDRIKLTLLTRDPNTGALHEKGRFNEITFSVSSDFEEIPGEAELEFYKEAGLEFVTLKGAGKKAGDMVSSFGDQYMNRYFLQRIERKLAKRLGLDVISFETSIASNYFNYLYDNKFDNLAERWDYLAFANIGITLGRYFMRDKVFLKWRTELVPRDLFLTPEHSIGFEYQPIQYFWLDFNYGFYRNEDIIEYNPKLNMQLRIPITRLRKFFNF